MFSQILCLKNVLLLWGGIDTQTMTCTNELMEIKISCSDKKNKRTLSGAKRILLLLQTKTSHLYQHFPKVE